MIDTGINYDKTVETNKIVFKGQTYQKIISYIFIFILTSFSLGISYYLFKTQIQNSPSIIDYFVATLFPVLILSAIGYTIHLFLTRDKLKEFEINIRKSKAIEKILAAARNLGWELNLATSNYIVFRTKFEFTKGCQTVTLIVFPNDKIYFNSMDFPNDYLKFARFDKNFQELKTEYLKIENE